MIKEEAFAKFNLNLHIVPERSESGFFPLKLLNYQADLKDEIYLEPLKKRIKITCDHPNVPKGENNFMMKVAIFLKKLSANHNLGARITLKKNISIKAGLGGGSSDAAATLRGLLKLWQLQLKENQLKELAKQLGQDFYYSYYGGLCQFKIEDYNYQLSPLPYKLPSFWLLIITPKEEKPSTAWMYQNIKVSGLGKNMEKLERLKKAIQTESKSKIINNLFNDFEEFAGSIFPVVTRIKKDLIREGALQGVMTGAGLSMIGFFENKDKTEKAFHRLKNKYKQVLISKTV